MVDVGERVVEFEVRMSDGAGAQENRNNNGGTHLGWIRRWWWCLEWTSGVIGLFDLILRRL